MARFFMSYRRDESSGHAGRLADRLRIRFGRDSVFLDVDLAPGVEFAEQIRATIAACDAVLVVIGPRWATVENADGTRRLDDPEDLVRVEVETALQLPGVTAIPVLVDGAAIPKAHELPASLQPLVRRNALEITDSRFDYDASRLVDSLDGATRRSRAVRATRWLPRRRYWIAALPVVAAVALAAYLLRPNNVVVPDVVGAPSVFAAQTPLVAGGLNVGAKNKLKVTGAAKPGTVIGQAPAAGASAGKGAEVILQVAIGSKRVTVPNIVGKTAEDAEGTLSGHDLTLGQASPHPVDPDKRVSSQVPAAAKVVNEGTPVDIFFREGSG